MREATHKRGPIIFLEWMMRLSNGKVMFHRWNKLSVPDIEEGQLLQFDLKNRGAFYWDCIISVVELPNQILLGTVGVATAGGEYRVTTGRFFLDLNKSENNITFKERPSLQDKTWDYLPVLALPNNVVVAQPYSYISGGKAAICFFQMLETGNLFMIAEVPLLNHVHGWIDQIIQLKDGNILVFVRSKGSDYHDYHGKIIDINTKRVKSEFVVKCLIDALEMRPGVLALLLSNLLKDGNELVFWSLKQNKIIHKLSLPYTVTSDRHHERWFYKNMCAPSDSTLCICSKDTLYLYDCPVKFKYGVLPKQKGSEIERLSTKEHCCAIF